MKSEAFVSELHDIGKLVDMDSLEGKIKFSGQTFQNFDFSQLNISKPSSPNWFTQYSNEIKSLASTKLPKLYLPDVLLTSIADELSSTISRTRRGSKDFEEKKKKGEFKTEGLHVLWNPSFYEKEKERGHSWAAFRTSDELKQMFKFIDECKNSNEFFGRFEKNLRLTAEDKSVPFNVTDLFTHLELTGKVYRVLKNHSKTVSENNKLCLDYNGERIIEKREASGGRINEGQRGKWIFRLLFCYVKFPQSLSRLQDLNIFKIRTERIRAFSENEKTKDYVLFFTDDFMCLFVPKDQELSLNELLKPFTDKGLIIDYTEMEAELNLLTSSYERAYHEFHALPQTNRHLNVYEKQQNSQLQPEIGPNICDSCQIREGKERIKEQVRECLCDSCNEIRQDIGKPATEYAKWEGKAAWMKITLDQDWLKKMLLELFEEYVDNSSLMNNVASGDKTELKNSFRPLAVQMDFVKDYKILLHDFEEKIYTIKDEAGKPAFTNETFLYPIDNYNEFGMFKVNSGKDVLSVIGTFIDCMDEIFPKCTTIGNSPIRLAISIAPVKYPYQEHWHFLSEPKGTIDIKSPSGRLTFNASQYRILWEKIGKANVTLSHFLHRLTEIKARTDSDTMVQLEVCERNNRNKFPVILELLEEGLTPQQILAFYNFAQEEKE